MRSKYLCRYSLAFLMVAGFTSGCDDETATLSCLEGQTDCSGTCVDLTTDPRHCGACEEACAAGEVCAAGECAVACPGAQEVCNGGCFDLESSIHHCGDCDTACSEGEVCAAGACAASCPGTQIECGGECVEPATDRGYCGATGDCAGANAGAVCNSGEVCAAGACEVSCPGTQIECGGGCVEPTTDRGYCGATGDCAGANAGTVCGAGEICAAGACVVSCGPGLTQCDGSCVDTEHDPDHCGKCGWLCQNGCFDGLCIDLDVCEYGSDCESGICQGGLCATGCNLIVNGSAEVGDLSGWTIMSSTTYGWHVETGVAPPPNERDSHNFITSHQLDRKSQVVDLAAAGYSANQLAMLPDIYVCDWVRRRYTGANSTIDHFYITTNVRDASDVTLASWNVGSTSSLQTTSSDVWALHEHTYTGNASPIATVYFEDGGEDGEHWAHWYGARFDGARITVLGIPCPSCSDGVQNQDETGVDCGGVCPVCP